MMKRILIISSLVLAALGGLGYGVYCLVNSGVFSGPVCPPGQQLTVVSYVPLLVGKVVVIVPIQECR